MKNTTKVLIVVAVVAAALAVFVKFSSKQAVTAQFRPCVWPNTCVQKVEVAQFQPCVWPRTCGKNNS